MGCLFDDFSYCSTPEFINCQFILNLTDVALDSDLWGEDGTKMIQFIIDL